MNMTAISALIFLPTLAIAESRIELRVAIGDGVSAFALGEIVNGMNDILDESADPACRDIEITHQPLMRFNAGLVPDFDFGTSTVASISQLAVASNINVVVARNIGACGDVSSDVIGCTYQLNPAIVELYSNRTAELWLHEIFHSYKMSWDSDGDEGGGADEDKAHVNDWDRLMYYAVGGRSVAASECAILQDGIQLFSPQAAATGDVFLVNDEVVAPRGETGEPALIETPLEELLARAWIHGFPFQFLDSTGLDPAELRQQLRIMLLTNEKWPLWTNALTVLAFVSEPNDLNVIRFVLKSDLGELGAPSRAIVEIKRSAFAAFAYVAGQHGNTEALLEMTALLASVQESGDPSQIESFASLGGVDEGERSFAQVDLIYGALAAANVIAAANPELPSAILAEVASLVDPRLNAAPNARFVELGLSPEFFPQLVSDATDIQSLGLELSTFGEVRD